MAGVSFAGGKRRLVVEKHVGHLGHGHLLPVLVEQVDSHGAEGAAELDYPGLGCYVGQAGGEEADVIA